MFANGDSLDDKCLFCLCNNFENFDIGRCMNCCFVSGFAQQLHRKNAEVPDIYFVLLNVARVSPTLVWNKIARTKERGSWVPSKIRTAEVPMVVHSRCCRLKIWRNLSRTLVCQYQRWEKFHP